MNIITWIKPTKKPTHLNNSGINYDEIWEFYPEFFDKCFELLTKGSDKTKSFINSILEFLEDWDILTWKQFNSVFKSHLSFTEYQKHISNGTYSVNINSSERLIARGTVQFICADMYSEIPNTDQNMDRLHEKIFGNSLMFQEEEEGYVKSYKNGERIFLLPTEENMGNIWDL